MQKRKSSWARYLIALLLVAIAALGYAEFSNHYVSNLVARMFGPPKVDLHESYSDQPDGQIFDHSSFNSLLNEHVDEDGWVDYRQLGADADRLQSYIDAVGKVDIDSLGRNERLAFLINAYNAFTLKLIVENYPLESIEDIPEADRWAAIRWNLGGEAVSLNQIEHEFIRPHFKEPRIHFALVCAAIGCPPLRNEAFAGAQIEDQLTDQTSYVHRHKTWFSYDNVSQRLKLTELYKWYGDDFVQVAGSVESFAAEYAPQLAEDLSQGKKPAVTWLKYDWTLNDSTKRSER